jgi:hypothetical protein
MGGYRVACLEAACLEASYLRVRSIRLTVHGDTDEM